MAKHLEAALAAASEFEGMLAHRPELLERYRAFMLTLKSEAGLPVRLLELCRVRIAQIHDCAAELAIEDPAAALCEAQRQQLATLQLDAFTEAEQAALALAEKMPFAHHELTDAEVSRADAAFGHAGCVALLTTLAFYDVTCRLKLTLGVEAKPQTVAEENLV